MNRIVFASILSVLTILPTLAMAEQPLGTRPIDGELRSIKMNGTTLEICWHTFDDNPMCASFAAASGTECAEKTFTQHVKGYLQRNFGRATQSAAGKLNVQDFGDIASLLARHKKGNSLYAATAQCKGTNLYALIIDLKGQDYTFLPEGLFRLERTR